MNHSTCSTIPAPSFTGVLLGPFSKPVDAGGLLGDAVKGIGNFQDSVYDRLVAYQTDSNTVL